MILLITGFIVALYSFARKVMKNEPLKRQLDTIFNKTNRNLSFYKEQKTRLLLDGLLKISNKGILYSLILIFISLLFSENIENKLILIFGPILIISMLLSSSISWFQHHNKTLKEYFLNIQMLGLLFSPLIFYYIGKDTINPDIDITEIFKPFNFLINKFGIFTFQIIWILVMSITLYFGALIIAFPIYIILYTLILTTVVIIRTIEKYIDEHIIDGMVGITVVVIAFIKIWN
jgi:hypothetical protein